MLEYDRIDISEGIDTEKTNKSKECKICHYWYFKDINFNMNNSFVMVVMIQCKKLLVLIILLFFMLKEVLTEFSFGI